MAIGLNDNVRYFLYSKRQGKVEIPTPINYEEGNGNIYERDSDSKGILTTKGNSVELFDEGYDFLIGHNAIDGIDDVMLIKDIKDRERLDERWRNAWTAHLDPSDLVFDDKRRSVKAKYGKGGLEALLSSRKSDDYDLMSNTSIDGKDIGEIQRVKVVPTPRKIYLETMYKSDELDLWVDMRTFTSDSSRTGNKGLPLEFKYQSDDLFSQPSNSGSEVGYSDGQNGTINSLMYINNDRRKTQEISLKFNFTILDYDIVGYPSNSNLNFFFRIYDGGEDFNLKESETIFNVSPIYNGNKKGKSFSFEFNKTITLEKGESWSFIVQTQRSGGNSNKHNIKIGKTEGSYCLVKEDSTFGETTNDAMTLLQEGERITAHITGENNRFRSDLLSTGALKDVLVTSGWWVRNFPDIVKEGTEEEVRTQFITSFQDYIDAIEAIMPIAWMIEQEGGVEYLRLEDLRYTQRKQETIRFGIDTGATFTYLQAQDVKRTVLGGNYYTKLELGTEKGGDEYNEEVNGLRTITGKATFHTPNIGSKEEIYSNLSPYRHSSEAIELTRRKQYSDYPEASTPRDSDLMLIMAKKQGTGYVCKLWQDLYVKAPTGVYDVNSEYNFQLSPMHLLINHGYVINVGLVHKLGENVRWISSNCNSSMETDNGVIVLKENDVISIAKLEKPRVYPMTLDFTLPVEQELEDQIRGKGDFPNWYGMVGANINGEVTYCYIIKSDTNKEGRHKVIPVYT